MDLRFFAFYAENPTKSKGESMENQAENNKMGTMRVDRLLLGMGLPMIVSMVLQAVYNIVDSAFVSNMEQNGEAALGALTLAFPVQMLLVAIGIGTGVGANALLSRALGEGDRARVNRIAGNAVFLAAVIYVVFALFGVFGVRTYVYSQTKNALIADFAVQYLRICCTCACGIVFFSIYEKLLQATGRSMLSTVAQIAGAVTNMVLDPIMIYGWFGCPALGVAGAAWATVIGQCVSCALALGFHCKANREIENSLRYLKPCGALIGEIYTIGLPAILAQALMSVMTYGMNLILGGVSEAAVTAYGLYYKMQQFVLFAAFGLRDAITPVVSFNYGMRSRERVCAGMRYGMGFTIAIMVIGLTVVELCARPLTGVFGLSEQTAALCMGAMRIVSLSFVCAGANIAFQGIFQALGAGSASLIVSVFRQFVFVLPVAWGFARLAQRTPARMWLVWSTFPLAELLTAVIACVLLRHLLRTKLGALEA